MKQLLFVMILLPMHAWSITPCSEHGYCVEQGIPHIRHNPEFNEKQLKICPNTTFEIRFGLSQGKPTNVEITAGPIGLDIREVVKSSFMKWRFNGVLTLDTAKETLEFDAFCNLMEHEGTEHILRSQNAESY